MASLPPIVTLYIDNISPYLNFIMIGTAWSSSLVPLFVILFYFSTPALRLQPIFIMNVLSVTMGIVLGFNIAAISIKGIRHPEVFFNVNAAVFELAGALVLPIFVDVILAFRLSVVLPRHTTPASMLCIVFIPLALFKVGRVINIAIFMSKFVPVIRTSNPATILSSGFDHFNPHHKIEWSLLVIDNCYASGFFLWKIGMGRRMEKSSGIVSSAKDTFTRLFYLGTASFIFPCMLGIGQLVFAFSGRGAYLALTNAYVEIVCSLLATLWTAQTRWSDRNSSQQPEASYMSSFRVKPPHESLTTGRSITIDPANAWNRSIVESSVDLDAVRVASEDEIDILGNGIKIERQTVIA
ncbi:hypothetical protein CCMSSC00406_0006319 [Pleurotus cornucopiae]|uniref:Uncharacterized protein n=1 Tax=Pleurotus cornucopiae TaxID=5321 RepID=A0ACB7IRW3_PLECO|nr:hypothetical protein CCMSSC00406_0006319 [Pleurotus cornucopiae]